MKKLNILTITFFSILALSSFGQDLTIYVNPKIGSNIKKGSKTGQKLKTFHVVLDIKN